MPRLFLIIIFIFSTTNCFAQSKTEEVDNLIEAAKKMGDSLQEDAILLSNEVYDVSKKLITQTELFKAFLLLPETVMI